MSTPDDHPLHRRFSWFLPAILLFPALAALILYLPTLNLPLLYDDLLHIRIVKGLNWRTVWLPTESFGFYRPLTFVPLLLIKQLFGYYPAWLLHGLNIGQHALNGSLLALLVWRLGRRPFLALIAGLLLVTFPFSYQAIAVYGHNVHPTTAGLLLLACHTYINAINKGASRWWFFTTLLFILSLLSHESAILFGPLALLLHLAKEGWSWPIRDDQGHYQRLLKMARPYYPALLFTLAGLVYAILYQFLPISRAPQVTTGGGTLVNKALYLYQASAYPVVDGLSYLPWVEGRWVVGLGLLVTALLTWFHAGQVERRPWLLLGWGWWFLASTLIGVALPADYLLHGPRLLYLPSLGLALVWAALLWPGYPAQGRVVGRIALLLLLLGSSTYFVYGRLNAYQKLTAPLAEVEEHLAGSPAEDSIILINFPQWLAPTDNHYPIGIELVAMLGDYLFIEELLVENIGLDRPVQAGRITELQEDPATYQYGLHDQHPLPPIPLDDGQQATHIFITSYTAAGPQTTYTGASHPLVQPVEPLATFGPYQLLSAGALICNQTVQLRTEWAQTPTAAPPKPTVSIFAQLLTAAGQLAAQADGPLLGLRPDLLLWPPDQQVSDRRSWAFDTPEAETILLGVYDYATGQRFPAYDEAGQPLPDNGWRFKPIPCAE